MHVEMRLSIDRGERSLAIQGRPKLGGNILVPSDFKFLLAILGAFLFHDLEELTSDVYGSLSNGNTRQSRLLQVVPCSV